LNPAQFAGTCAVLSVAASESLAAETDDGSPKILQSRIKKVKRAMHERKH
jgi:hypothetical protein